ncbi:MAG: thymidine phosphorylase [Rhizobiales bacterium]|nr:thymidine phosphorylase [Hyphomicrobiales bacterium]NRB15351.1 thymidine phosphorylase [Hyphomicrobiales bacterium]
MKYLPQEIIRKKRDGGKLSNDEIGDFIAGIKTGTTTDVQVAAFTMSVFFNDLSTDERVALTLALRDSGDVMEWGDVNLDGPVLDKHSTGGIGDNVSLMLAPILAVCGAYVPMISGRGLGHTGGTLDKLDSIPGYDTVPDPADFRRTVKDIGCAVIGQTPNMVPADKKMYGIRDVTASVEADALITPSILSKKLASGLNGLILDVKTGSGAFMDTIEKSESLANSLLEVARQAGLPTSAIITDMNQPLASAVGNAVEVKNAVDFLTGKHIDQRLYDVTMALCAEMLILGSMETSQQAAEARVAEALSSGKAAECFGRMCAALKGPADFIENMDKYLEFAPVVMDIKAPKAGIVADINTRNIGLAAIKLGAGRTDPSADIDYGVGFEACLAIGAKVDAGQPIARVIARSEDAANMAAELMQQAYIIGDDYVENKLIYKILNDKPI